MRYWYSEGKTRFDINSQRQSPILGNPTSTLTYDGIDANSLEFVFAVRNETRTFFKGFVGGGWLDNGSLDDEDFLAGQIKFSDTYSILDGDSMVYGTMDVGQDYTLVDRNARVVLSPSSASTTGKSRWTPTAPAAIRTMSAAPSAAHPAQRSCLSAPR